MTDSPSRIVAWSSVLLVPVLSVLGFVAWASFLGSERMPPVDLALPRYLAAGLLFALLFGPMVPFEFWLFRQGWLEPTGTWRKAFLRHVVVCLSRACVFGVAFTLIGSVLQSFQVVRFDAYELPIYAFAIGLFVAVGLIAMMAVGGAFGWLSPLLGRFLEAVGLSDIQVNERRISWLPRFGRAVFLGAPLAVWALVGASALGLVVLERVPSAYGGAMSLECELAIDPHTLPPSLWLAMASDANDSSNTTSWSRPLRVTLVTDGAFVLAGPGKGGPTVVSMEVVKASRCRAAGV